MSLSIYNSTDIPLVAGEVFLGKEYDSILEFAEIDISIRCNVGYGLTFVYSQDRLNVDYQTTQNITTQTETQFFKIPVKDKYFKIFIIANNGNMSYLNVQTIYKSSITFENNTRNTIILNNGSINANTNSVVANLSTIPVQLLTIYGTADRNCKLTVMFSNDNLTWYQSQYSYNIHSSPYNFGFAIQACPLYLCIQSDTTLTTFNAFVDYS